MSRIGRKPIAVPGGVTITVGQDNVAVQGPRGSLAQSVPASIRIAQEDGTLLVHRSSDEPNVRALHGLIRSLLANMVTGVTAGFTKTLLITGVGYRATKDGDNLRLAVGYSHPVEITAPPGITFDVPAPNRVVVAGINKEAVGEIAAKIRSVRPPEPYLGKGIRYENEVIRRKAGKAGKVGGK
ncbi:MAG TPA: 50S ribosomal protein L6 [Chloroflexota bacterium]|nr:50S ribosomal protein L6 [Chloroflexota bacterium]